MCNRTWDGWLCWDDTKSGVISEQHCPDYFHDFDPSGRIFASQLVQRCKGVKFPLLYSFPANIVFWVHTISVNVNRCAPLQNTSNRCLFSLPSQKPSFSWLAQLSYFKMIPPSTSFQPDIVKLQLWPGCFSNSFEACIAQSVKNTMYKCCECNVQTIGEVLLT